MAANIFRASTVSFLQEHPEVVEPAKFGVLWKQSKVLKTWLCRWFAVDRRGLVYACSAQGCRSGKPAIEGILLDVYPVKQPVLRDGIPMYGFVIATDGGCAKRLYATDREQRDAWIKLGKRLAEGGRQLVSDSYAVDFCTLLGSGLFADVFRGVDNSTREARAIKVIKTKAYKEYKDLVDREVLIWHVAGEHPHIVQLKDVLVSEQRVYFISELCDGGNLLGTLAGSSSYCERDVASIMRQVFEALRHLHSRGIVHMDLKPDNIVLATKDPNSPIKLLDFSMACFFNTPTEPGGTPAYVAPELLNKPERYAKQGCEASVDMWAAGVLLYYLLIGQTPFDAPKLEAIMELVKAGAWTFKSKRWDAVSAEAKDLISRLLQLEPSRRLCAADALSHPWLQCPSANSTALLQDAVASFKAHVVAARPGHKSSWLAQHSMGNSMTQRTSDLSCLSTQPSGITASTHVGSGFDDGAAMQGAALIKIGSIGRNSGHTDVANIFRASSCVDSLHSSNSRMTGSTSINDAVGISPRPYSLMAETRQYLTNMESTKARRASDSPMGIAAAFHQRHAHGLLPPLGVGENLMPSPGMPSSPHGPGLASFGSSNALTGMGMDPAAARARRVSDMAAYAAAFQARFRRQTSSSLVMEGSGMLHSHNSSHSSQLSPENSGGMDMIYGMRSPRSQSAHYVHGKDPAQQMQQQPYDQQRRRSKEMRQSFSYNSSSPTAATAAAAASMSANAVRLRSNSYSYSIPSPLGGPGTDAPNPNGAMGPQQKQKSNSGQLYKLQVKTSDRRPSYNERRSTGGGSSSPSSPLSHKVHRRASMQVISHQGSAAGMMAQNRPTASSAFLNYMAAREQQQLQHQHQPHQQYQPDKVFSRTPSMTLCTNSSHMQPGLGKHRPPSRCTSGSAASPLGRPCSSSSLQAFACSPSGSASIGGYQSPCQPPSRDPSGSNGISRSNSNTGSSRLATASQLQLQLPSTRELSPGDAAPVYSSNDSPTTGSSAAQVAAQAAPAAPTAAGAGDAQGCQEKPAEQQQQQQQHSALSYPVCHSQLQKRLQVGIPPPCLGDVAGIPSSPCTPLACPMPTGSPRTPRDVNPGPSRLGSQLAETSSMFDRPSLPTDPHNHLNNHNHQHASEV